MMAEAEEADVPIIKKRRKGRGPNKVKESDDTPLLKAFLELPNVQNRRVFISHLDERSLQMLCHRLKAFIEQQGHMKLPDNESNEASKILKPYKRHLKRLTDGNANMSSVVRGKRGGAIVSLILAAVVPILASLAIDAIKNKVNKK